MNTILSSMTDDELEARLYAEPNTPGAVEELLARFRALLDAAEEQEPLLGALAFNNLDTPLDINNAVDDQAELQTLLRDYECLTSKELRELLDNK